MKSIVTEFTDQGFNYDRLPSDSFALPYSIDDVKIQPNDVAVANVFNIKIKKLYDNFLYLYGLCFMSNFNVIGNYKGFYDEINGFIPTTYTPPYGQDLFNTATTGLTQALSTSTKAISYYNPAKPNVINTLFASNSTLGILTIEKIIEDIEYINLPLQLILTDGLTPGSDEYNRVLQNIERKRDYLNSYTGGVKFTQSSIDPISGSIVFQNIGGIAQINNETLYVTDSIYDNVYSFNLKDAASDDNIKKNILFQLNIVGGEGSVQEKLKFNTPTLLVNIRDNILVVDQINNCFKIFDKNLNWIATSTQSVFFEKYPTVNAITYYKPTHMLIVATNSELHLFNVNELFEVTFIRTVPVNVRVTPTGNIIDIKFANYDSEILYILTSKAIIKKWMSKLEKNIATFEIDDPLYGNQVLNTFSWMSLAPLNKNTDILLIKAGAPKSSIITILEDNLNLMSLLKQNDFDVYSKDDVCLKDDEYISSWTYNKCLKKLLYNLNLLVSNIIYRFYTRENETSGTTEFIFKTYNNLIAEKIIQDTNSYANLFINENFQSETINRCFGLLYDYQNYVLSNLTNNDPINLDLTPYRIT